MHNAPDPRYVAEISPWLLAIPSGCLEPLLAGLVLFDGSRRSIVEKSIFVTKHNTKAITAMLVGSMSKLDVILSIDFPRYDHQARPVSSPYPAASLPTLPMELFLWLIDNNCVSSCDIWPLRLACKEVEMKCRNRFYDAIDKSTVLLQLDAGFPARILALAKYQEWSDNITSVHLEVPRNKFFYASEQAHWNGRSEMDTTKDNFADMSGTVEYNGELALLAKLPLCEYITLHHDTASPGLYKCDFEVSRRTVKAKTMATMDYVLRENLEHGLVGGLF
jgi:hypothetical protein